MSTTYDAVASLTTMQCGPCGGTYAISEAYRAKKAQEGGYWHCPYCQCSWGYAGSENARLKQAVEDERQRVAVANERAAEFRRMAETQGRRAAAARGQVTKIKKRVANGSCPCCRQSFANLAAHMASQHPTYASEGLS
jgi:hypothetical protein